MGKHRSRFGRGYTRGLSLLATIAVTMLFLPSMSAAVVTDAELLDQFPHALPHEGSAAGQLAWPAATATDPVTGHVFIASANRIESNTRIDEFTPWGEFVKSFGWNVAPGAVNEQQEVRFRATAGQFRLSFGPATTPDLTFDATAPEVKAALEALSTIGSGNVEVTATLGNSETGVTPFIYIVTFKGSLSGTDVDQLALTSGSVPLSGGDPATAPEVRTRADGTSGGSGLEACTAESGCQAGTQGSAPGQFDRPEGVAVGPDGDIYVFDRENLRVQKFDSAGRFLLMFGGGVDQGPNHPGNLCTAAYIAEGDTCGAGTGGTASGQFNVDITTLPGRGFGNFIAVNRIDGTVYVGDRGRIQQFEATGAFKAQIPLSKSFNPGALAISPVSGVLYFAYREGAANVLKLDPSTGDVLDELTVQSPGSIFAPPAVAVDVDDNVYVAENGDPNFPRPTVLEFGSDGALVGSCCTTSPWPPPAKNSFLNIAGMATNTAGDLYVINFSLGIDSYVRTFGPAPVEFEAPPMSAPDIESQYAVSVGTDSAVIRADINPHFWDDTTYNVQFGVNDCSLGGCATLSTGKLTDQVVGTAVKTTGIVLPGLEPNTTYHYRFVAESKGGGPVFGPDRTLTTFPVPVPSGGACSNVRFRIGASAGLPNCRAYEMVSPVEKNNGDVIALRTSNSWPTALDQSSLDGERFTYTSYRSFANPRGGAYAAQYIASRDASSGWSTRAVSPPRGGPSFFEGALALKREFKAFSDDLTSAWLYHDTDPPLDPHGPTGYPNLYRYYDESGNFEALSRTKPTALQPDKYLPELQGLSKDGGRAIFRVNEPLVSGASVAGKYQLYEAFGPGKLRLVSVLPNGQPSDKNSSAGTANAAEPIDAAQTVSHAISDDGSRIFWTTESKNGAGQELGPGQIYLRINGKNPTIAVSSSVAGVTPSVETRFWTAASNGSIALFAVDDTVSGSEVPSPLDGNLYEFNVAKKQSKLLAGKVLGLLGASEDASRFYFLSEEALGSGSVAGKPNLYFSNKGTIRFLAVLSDRDAGLVDPNTATAASPEPAKHAAQVTPSGMQLVFTATASPNGYDNHDVESGETDTEVYLYDASANGGAGKVDCISCNPSSARPHGRFFRSTFFKPWTGRWVGSRIPVGQTQLHTPRAISEDGSRVFFESWDALVLRDSNGAGDVYEWEAPGAAGCPSEGAPSFSKANGGCVSLISSGQSPVDSEFLDASPSGRDVFFTTAASLVPQDTGLVDVYNAREGGGFPPPPNPPAECEGDACQHPVSPPNDPTPASAALQGSGNLKEAPKRHRCAKKKVRRKGRCVAKKPKKKAAKHHKRKQRGKNGRAAR